MIVHAMRESLTTQGMIDARQCRAARAGLRWSVRELAKRAEVSAVTINRFERELAKPVPATRNAIQRALEAGGVEFVEENGGGPGLRFKRA
jgi:transcriptional regulator with XRE-family HTH domain